MGRIARNSLLFEGCFAHVFSRSIAKENIFVDRDDFSQFIDILKRIKVKGSFSIYHYCVMGTHFHMAVAINDVEAFSEGLRVLKRDYTYWYNNKYNRRGPLWRERFKSMLIEDERYLYICGRYIEYNPVKSGLVRNPCDWDYSSSRYYELGEKDNLIDQYDCPDNVSVAELQDEKCFTRGIGIGSKQFNILLRQEVGIK